MKDRISKRDHSPRPLKKWGQNFLRNEAAVRRIAAAVEPLPGELILEIGPGQGVLTRQLALLDNPILAIEIDPDLIEQLQLELGDRVELRLADATTAELPDQPFVAAGNLPYNVANPIIRRIIAADGFRRGVFMVQKEVANRLTAAPGSADYGFLTLAVALHARASILFTLGPGSFYPQPKVQSAVVIFERQEPQLQSSRSEVLELISLAFRARRKKLLNNLDTLGPREEIRQLLQVAGIDENARAEQLGLEAFDCLAAALRRR
jgi:16S rRNA (adenine1518-N6/adenine1519-N6)-dimethyltransferase